MWNAISVDHCVCGWLLPACCRQCHRNETAGGMTAQQRFDKMTSASGARSELKRHSSETNGRAHSGISSHSHQPPMETRRSRTPGPEHMRAPPDRSTDDRWAAGITASTKPVMVHVWQQESACLISGHECFYSYRKTAQLLEIWPNP